MGREAVVWETVANAHELDPQCPRSDICSTQGLCRPFIVKQLGVCCLWPIKTTMASANQNNNGPHGESVTSPRKSPHHLNLHSYTKPTACCHQKRPKCLQSETLASVTSRQTAPPQPPFQHEAHSLLSPKTAQVSPVGNFGISDITANRTTSTSIPTRSPQLVVTKNDPSVSSRKLWHQ